MLVAVGDKADRIVSWGAFITSADGKIWNTIQEPFDTRGKIWGVAYGNSKYVVVGDGGLVSYSTNGISWNTDRMWSGSFQPLSIYYDTNYSGNNGMFMAAGQNKFLTAESIYKENDEIACIFKNDTGDNWDWELLYSYHLPNSRFYSVKRLVTNTIDVWIALGSAESLPIGVYSLDNGLTWNSIVFPNNLGIKYAYDATITTNNGLNYWITVNGLILETDSLSSPNWKVSRAFTPRYGRTDFVKISANNIGHLVAVCSGGIAYTTNQSSWDFLEQPGYRFKSVIWFNNQWLVGAESNLTQYTHWISTDTINWTPKNCGVQIYDFTVV